MVPLDGAGEPGVSDAISVFLSVMKLRTPQTEALPQFLTWVLGNERASARDIGPHFHLPAQRPSRTAELGHC